MTESQPTLVRREGMCCRSLDGEAVLYDPAHHAVHYLNKTAYFIWSRCDGRRGAEDIAGAVADAFEMDGQRQASSTVVVSDVRRTLAELADNGLIDSGCQQAHGATCCDSRSS